MAEKLKLSGWFEIFRTGTWHGFKYEKDHLDQMVQNFDAGDPVPPLIIGHNNPWSDEKPAEGWVAELKRSGNRLMCKARQVSATLVEAVNDETFPMRSVELWPDWRGNKGFALSAVAFLGGSNPEVGGMEGFNFETRGNVKLAFAKEAERVVIAFNADDGLGDPDEFVQYNKGEGGEGQMTEEQIEAMFKKRFAAEVEPIRAQVVALEGKNTALETANAELKTQLSATVATGVAAAVQAKLESCKTFAKGLLDQKRITPAVHEGGLAAFMSSLDDQQKFKFAGDKEVAQLDHFKSLLSALPVVSGATLFNVQDGDAARPNEDIDGAIAEMAAKEGIDPALLAKNFQMQKSLKFGAGAGVGEDQVVFGGSGISIAAQPKAKAA